MCGRIECPCPCSSGGFVDNQVVPNTCFDFLCEHGEERIIREVAVE